MTVAYVIALVVGGGFMALSLFSDFLEGADVDLDADFDMDADVDVELGGGGGGGAGALKILSLRTAVYALFGFGAVGVMLGRLWGPDNASQTAVFATAGGLATGMVASALFGLLKRSDSGDRLGEASFVGLTGKVTLPLDESSPGRVSVFRGDRRIALRALPHASADNTDPGTWSDVIVVEMDAGIARVIPVDDTLELPPGS